MRVYLSHPLGNNLPRVYKKNPNVSKGKMYTFQHFKKMGCKKTAIYRVMKLVDAGESVEQKEGQGRPRKLTSAQERKVKLAFNNKKNALTLPFTNLHKIVH